MGNRVRGSRALYVPIVVGAVLALLLPCAVAAQSKRPPSLELIDSDPGQNAILSSGEPLYLRFRYRSGIPIHILVSGSYQGEVVDGLLQDSDELFPPGKGEAVVWLAYPSGTRIDGIRVRVRNAKNRGVASAAFPILAEWVDASATGEAAQRETKSWVADLTTGQRERIAEMLRRGGEERGFHPVDLIFLSVPGYFLLQAALTFWTSGGWRVASLVPAVLMVPILAYTVSAFAAQSNLWPVLLLLSAPLAFLYLVALSVILLLRRLARPA